MRLNHGSGRRFICRDLFGLFVLFLLLAVIFYDKNPLEALGPRKTFDKIDRVVTVKLAVDKTTANPKDLNKILFVMDGASYIFEKSFGVRFVFCGSELWKNHSSVADIRQLRRDVKNGPCDIVFAFTKRKLDNSPETVLRTGGIAAKETIIVRDSGDIWQDQLVLAHELAHLFLAFHTENKKSIMSPVLTRNETGWDEWNWRMIVFNKYKNFHKYDF